MDKRHGIAMICQRAFWTGPVRAMFGMEEEKQEPPPPYDIQDAVAMIPVRGLIDKAAPSWSSYRTSPIRAANAVIMAAADPKVKSIMLTFDSPGGYADGMWNLAEAIFKARDSKKIVSQIDGMAASAAYWAASQSHKVYIGPMDMAGSIGTYSLVMDDSKMIEDMGVKIYLVSSGGLKGAGEVGQPITEEYLKEVEKMVLGINEFFMQGVMRGRGMSRKDVTAIADGRMWLGKEAVAKGLADKVQTPEATFESLRSAVRGNQAREHALASIEIAAAGIELMAISLGLKTQNKNRGE